MQRIWPILGSLAFFVIAPGTILVLVPQWITQFHRQPAFFDADWLRTVGAALIAAGLVPLIHSCAVFAFKGLGTPAPVAPPKHLVVSGFYRYVRNPMYVGLVLALVGEALFFGNVRLIFWAAAFWLMTHLFVIGYEEPALTEQFGKQYETFRGNVPRWIPRLTPWASPG